MCKRSSFISYIKYILLCLMLDSMLPWHTQRSYKLSDTTPGGGGGLTLEKWYYTGVWLRLEKLHWGLITSWLHSTGCVSSARYTEWDHFRGVCLLHPSQNKNILFCDVLSLQTPCLPLWRPSRPLPKPAPWSNSVSFTSLLSTTGSFPKLVFLIH